MGDDEYLIPPNKQNPKGFYEHESIPDINRVIMKSEHRIGEYEPASIIDSSVYKNEVEAFFSRTFEGRDRIALKDPRLCVTLPVWADVIEKTHDLTLLIVRRDLDDHVVALRDGGKKTVLEARDYINNRRALQRELSQSYNSIEVNFEEFLMYPEDRIRWLVKELKTRALKKQMADIMSFIKG